MTGQLKEQDCFVNGSSNMVCSFARLTYRLAGNAMSGSILWYCNKNPKMNTLKKKF